MEDHYERNEIFSKAVRAGKRTYFFDVKSTRSEEYYLTITESKRKFQSEDGRFSYEKHKLFLYKEDFEKFTEGLEEVIGFIRREQEVIERGPSTHQQRSGDSDDTFDDGNLSGSDYSDKEI